MTRPKTACRNGFTLIELVAVVTILALVAVLAVSRVDRVGQSARQTAAAHDLVTLRDAFLDPESGYLRDFRGIPGFSVGYLRLANLLTATNLYGAVELEDGHNMTFGCRVGGPEWPETGCARLATFVQWNAETERGWRGPYVKDATGSFPSRDTVRFLDDATAEARGFFPRIDGLLLPDEWIAGYRGCSVYGFPGEPAVLDPWGNPYVLQIPPPQAFGEGGVTNVADEVRFRFARIVSAGPDGRLDTPCFGINATNRWMSGWTEPRRRAVRQAGLIDGDRTLRGDDLVLFLMRNDIDEEGVE